MPKLAILNINLPTELLIKNMYVRRIVLFKFVILSDYDSQINIEIVVIAYCFGKDTNL